MTRSHRVCRAAPVLLAVLAAACGDAGSAEMLPPGRYLYIASHPTPLEEDDSIRLEGVLEIGEDGDGAWEVPQLHPELEVRSGEDGLILIAHPTYFGTIEHRVEAGSARLGCEGEYHWIADGGVERTLPLTCTLSTDVPDGYVPAVPTISTPAVRPADIPPAGPRP